MIEMFTRIYTALFQIRAGKGNHKRYGTFDDLARTATEEIKKS